MIITYHGEGCFRVQSGSFSLVLDPPNERFKADIVLKTEAPHSEELILRTNPKEVLTGGNYEIGGVRISGFQAPETNEKKLKTIYVAEIEDMKLGFLGKLRETPQPEIMEEFADVHILFVPLNDLAKEIGLDPQDAAKVIKQVEPRIAIPTHTKNPREFLKELGKTAEPTEKLAIKKKELPASLEVVWIKE